MTVRAMRIVQGMLLWVYRGVQRSGVLETALGRRAFESAYWVYKSAIEAGDVKALRSFVSPGSTVVDVGANIGFFTVRFLEWTRPNGRVIAIEPETANFRSLGARIARRGLDDGSAILVNAAAVEQAGHVFLRLNPDNPADHRVADSGTQVAAVSIDGLLEAHGAAEVSLIKVDVQGGELRVLRGARKVLAERHPALFVEIDDAHLSAAGTSAGELLSELGELGYGPNLLERDGQWREATVETVFERMRSRGYLDVLFLPRRGPPPPGD